MKQKTKQTKNRELPEGWEIKKLGEVAKFQYGLGESAEKTGEFVYVRITDINADGTLNNGNLAYIGKNKVKDNSILKKGDVLVARTGATYGKTILFNEDFNATYGGFLIRILFDKGKIDNNFFFQFSRGNNYWGQATGLVSGGAQPQFNANVVSEIKIPLPPLLEQISIAKILSDLDAKIELNNKMNKTLEAIGKVLFKKWFVDERKKEWEIKKIKDIVAEKKHAIVDGPFGTQLHNDEYVSEGVPIIRIINLSFEGHFINENLVFITEDKFDELKRSAIYPGDILLAKTGATIGKFSITPDYIKKGIIASSVLKISPAESNKHYLYYFIKDLSDKKYWESVSSGSTRSTINLIDVRDIEIVIPDLETLGKFELLTEGFFSIIENNNLQSQRLSKIRDLLLPKLMSGEIRVKN